jgi:hypothetical protein
MMTPKTGTGTVGLLVLLILSGCAGPPPTGNSGGAPHTAPAAVEK